MGLPWDLETARNGSAVLRNAISTKNLEGIVKLTDIDKSIGVYSREKVPVLLFYNFIYGIIRYQLISMGEEHNVVFGQGLKVNRAKSTLTSPSLCLMRHIEGEVSVLLALLTLGPCPKNTLCSSPIVNSSISCWSPSHPLSIQ